MLSKEVLGGIYTNEQAVRAYLYDKAGQDLGLNKADTQDLIALVEGNPELKAYAEEISKITKLDNGYPPIPEQWLGGSIATDMAVVSNRAQRTEFLQEFILQAKESGLILDLLRRHDVNGKLQVAI